MNNPLTEYLKTQGLQHLAGGMPFLVLLIGSALIAGFIGYLIKCHVMEQWRKRRMIRRRERCLKSNLARVGSALGSRPLAARVPDPIRPQEAVEADEAGTSAPDAEEPMYGRLGARRCRHRSSRRAVRQPKPEAAH